MTGLKKVFKVIHKISWVFSVISAVAMMVMALTSTIDVIMRYIFKNPITGSMEVVQVAMCIFVYGGLGLAVAQDRMIFVPVITEKLPVKVQGIIKGIGNFLCAIMGFLIMYELTIPTATRLQNMNMSTDLLDIPYGPIYLFVTIAYALISIELLIKGIENIYEGFNPPPKTPEEEEAEQPVEVEIEAEAVKEVQ